LFVLEIVCNVILCLVAARQHFHNAFVVHEYVYVRHVTTYTYL
jgi:hypothetical protein